MNANTPLVCICIPTYNAQQTIRETLVSIINQSYQNLAIHIVDNASTDNTLAVVAEFNDPRICIHRHAENVGGEGNFNRCIQLANGKYTAIYHADDLYEPDMVSRQVEFLEQHSTAGAVFTEASLVDENSQLIGAVGWPTALKPHGPLYNFPLLFKAVLQHANFFICPSAMVRTDIYQQEIKGWRGEMFGSSADLDVWLRIAQQHPVGLIAEPLMRYRISAAQYSAQDRASTEKAVMFRVLDYCLQQPTVCALLDAQDLRHYAALERRNRIGRAVNLLLASKPQEARALCHDIFSWDALRAIFVSERGFLTWLAGCSVQLTVLLGLAGLGQRLLPSIRRATFKWRTSR